MRYSFQILNDILSQISRKGRLGSSRGHSDKATAYPGAEAYSRQINDKAEPTILLMNAR